MDRKAKYRIRLIKRFRLTRTTRQVPDVEHDLRTLLYGMRWPKVVFGFVLHSLLLSMLYFVRCYLSLSRFCLLGQFVLDILIWISLLYLLPFFFDTLLPYTDDIAFKKCIRTYVLIHFKFNVKSCINSNQCKIMYDIELKNEKKKLCIA